MIFYALLLSFFCPSFATDPGFRLRITRDGLNYANQVAVELVSQHVRSTKIPDQSGEGKNVHYSLSGLVIQNFQPPKSTITLASESDLQWKASNTALELDGKFSYKYKKGIVRFSGKGRFNVKFSDISFSVGVALGVANEKPTIKANKCSCDSGPVKVKFRGGLAWIYNLFSGKVEKAISNQFKDRMCSIIQNLIDKNAQESLSTMKVQVDLGKFFTLDYRLVTAPRVTPEFIEGDMKGEIFWTNGKTEAPFNPPPMAAITANKKMIYITLSEYVFNTMTYQAHNHNFLVFNITSQNVKGQGKDILNTTCTTGMCIGQLIPQIGKTYPNCKVELHMKTTKAPVTDIREGSLGISAEGNITLYARKSDNSLHYLFRISGNGSTNVNLSIADQTLHGNIENTKINIKVTGTAIGTINEKALQFLTDGALKTTIIPMINELGAKGFPMPSTDSLQFKNSDFKLLQNTILIGTDLKFVSSSSEPKSTVLKFVPKNLRQPLVRSDI